MIFVQESADIVLGGRGSQGEVPLYWDWAHHRHDESKLGQGVPERG